ncbi:MAG: hypothetical protein Q8O30_05925 [Candidatus Omnitrophota bacterium]|nr:hypothetical protein [Candidatus Omnitrophota bacterium]
MRSKKAVVLVVVLGVMVVLSVLAFVAVNLMTQESRIAEHKIRRICAFYAAQAGYVDAVEQLRRGSIAIPAAGAAPFIYSIQIGAGTAGYPAAGYTVNITIVRRGDITVPATQCPADAPSDCCIFATVDEW